MNSFSALRSWVVLRKNFVYDIWLLLVSNQGLRLSLYN